MASDLDKLISTLKECKVPSESEIRELCKKAQEILVKENNVVILNPPISICGDLHGQFYDLLELFAVGDDCPESSYCFMGDYVDRGYYSLETFLFLLSLKVRYPTKMTMLRGNHESRKITQVYGFYDECIKKFGSPNVYNYCTNIFDFLPVSAVIGGEFFAVHGGLSPQVSLIDQINEIERKEEVPNEGIICDLMWSDPEDIPEDWIESPRCAGYQFGPGPVKQFNQANNLKCVLRAHQLVLEGYRYMFDETLCTVWSAPNYCYRCGNVASILEVNEEMNRAFKIFEAAPSTHQVIPGKEPPPPAYFL